MLATEGHPECERCGGPVYDEEPHAKACGESPFDADTCPMCGESFERYLAHLEECDGGR